MNNSYASTGKKLNRYERAHPAISRAALTGGAGCLALFQHLRGHLPSRTSRFHQCIESDIGSMALLLEGHGYQYAGSGSSGVNGLYLRPGEVWPDIFTHDRLAWSLNAFPGAHCKVCIKTDAAIAFLHVGDIVAVFAAHSFGGDERAMLDAHTAA